MADGSTVNYYVTGVPTVPVVLHFHAVQVVLPLWKPTMWPLIFEHHFICYPWRIVYSCFLVTAPFHKGPFFTVRAYRVSGLFYPRIYLRVDRNTSWDILFEMVFRIHYLELKAKICVFGSSEHDADLKNSVSLQFDMAKGNSFPV